MQPLIIRQLGLLPYTQSYERMQRFTQTRDSATPDEIWILEHEPVYTQGQAGKAEHLLNPGNIPVVQADRGGQVTYHGPGQLVIYLLLDLKRNALGVRDLVTLMEQSVVDLLADYGIQAAPKADAPGVYVEGRKICSLGLRVRRGCSFHGLALNVDMDMEPFLRINPCGYAGMEMTQMSQLASGVVQAEVAQQLTGYLSKRIGYNNALNVNGWE